MLETVKERHLRKHVAEEQEPNGIQQPHKSIEAEETTENSTSAVERTEEERDETPQRSDAKPDDPQSADSTTSPSPPGHSTSQSPDGCRLVPRLIDVRRSVDVRRDGVQGSIVVDVTRENCVPEFLKWARQRAEQVSSFGLHPMHVLMTADGGITADQQKFLKGILEMGLPSVCILGNGYDSLKPFFVQETDAVEEPGAKAAREMLKKGIGNLQSLWQKAPTRQHLWEKVAADGGHRTGTVESSWSSATFDRAPLPPSLDGDSGDGGYSGTISTGS